MTLDEWINNPTIKSGSLNKIMWHLVEAGIEDPSPQRLGATLRAAGWTRVHLRKGARWLAPGVDRAAAGIGTSAGVRMLIRNALVAILGEAEPDGRILLTELRSRITAQTGIQFPIGSPSIRLVNDALEMIGYGSLAGWRGEMEKCGDGGKDRRKVYIFTPPQKTPVA